MGGEQSADLGNELWIGSVGYLPDFKTGKLARFLIPQQEILSVIKLFNTLDSSPLCSLASRDVFHDFGPARDGYIHNGCSVGLNPSGQGIPFISSMVPNIGIIPL